MRIKCKIKVRKLPISYHSLFVSLIKKALSIVDNEYFYNLYNYDTNKANKKSKNFTFCVLLDSYELNNDELIINENNYVYFKLSSKDTKLIMYLYNGLLKTKKFKYKEYEIEILSITKESEKIIKENKINCCFKSPLVLKDKAGKFIDSSDTDFEDEINYYADMNLKNYRGYGLKKKLIISNVNMKKTVIKEKNYKYKLKDNTLYINASIGNLQLEGDIIDLQDLYGIGLGARRSQGFGYFDIL